MTPFPAFPQRGRSAPPALRDKKGGMNIRTENHEFATNIPQIYLITTLIFVDIMITVFEIIAYLLF
jgi:hypothetical protein